MSKRKEGRQNTAWVAFLEACEIANVDHKEIMSASRNAGLVRSRAAVAKYLRARGFTYQEIGYAMNRHHASILRLVDDAHREKHNKHCRDKYRASR